MIVDGEERLLALLAKQEPTLRRALLNALQAARAELTVDTLVEMIEAGRFEEAVQAAAQSGAISVAEGHAAVYYAAGRDAARFLSDAIDVTVGFDQVNERAVAAMRAERLRIIEDFTEQQRMATRDALARGIERGQNPRQQALSFRNSIGLHPKQQAAVDNYRHLLETNSRQALTRQLRDRRFDSSLKAAIRRGEPLTAAQIDRMVERYSERYLKYRAETIAQTEAMRAVHSGNHEAYLQAIEEGHVDPDRLSRKWVSAEDGRVRPSHARLNGLVRRIDETFPGDEGPIRFPGDPNAPRAETIRCRCSLSSRIDAPKR